MKEQFVTYPIALKLKELGFNEECFGKYYINPSCSENDRLVIDNCEYMSLAEFEILAPLWQQCEQWFREKYNYYIATYRLNNKWCGDVYDILRQCYITSNAFEGTTYNTYKEAREQAILEAIEIIKE